MTDAEIGAIVAKYKAGKWINQIAKEHHISWPKVRQILVDNGMEIRKYRRPPIPIGRKQMMVNDWNAGHSVERMARVYKYKNARSCISAIRYFRTKGYNFKPAKERMHNNER